MNVLDQINHYLSEEGRGELNALHEKMLRNKFVRDRGIGVTLMQWRLYFEKLRTGCEYALSKYGPGALPSKLNFYGEAGVIANADRPDVIFYGPDEDEFGISFLYAARQCSWFKTRDANPGLSLIDTDRGDDRLPEGRRVSVEDFVVLQAIEECYHRYQTVVKGMHSSDRAIDRSHPMEVEIGEVFSQAVRDLNIKLR
jgi:hypothetical protein